MKILNKIFLIIIFVFFTASSFAKDPSEFISNITETASELLKKDITIEERHKSLLLSQRELLI